jgi:drug/metabolite transporter (DMT)-like permease
METAFLVALAMCAFAANSLLTRAGVADGTDPLTFAAIRATCGAVVLAMIVLRRGSEPVGRVIDLRGPRRWGAAAALILYLLGFSLAYRSLDAGLGALILFACVQLGLLGLAFAAGERPSGPRLLGAGVALGGLGLLLWPGAGAAVDPVGAAAMAAAGLGWAFYTQAGRSEPRPLRGTAANFVLAAAAFVPLLPLTLAGPLTPEGLAYAALSGALASALGYALWFHVLPRLDGLAAGAAQLSVPVIAIAGGALWLGERPGPATLAACAVVLAGVGLAVVQPTIRSRGS